MIMEFGINADESRAQNIFDALHIFVTYDEAHFVLIYYGKSRYN